MLSGADGFLIHRLDNPNPQANAGFGSRIGSAGDVTGDGVPDLLLGAPANDFPAGCGNVPQGDQGAAAASVATRRTRAT